MFRLSSEYSPRGDQPQAIAALTGFVRENHRHMVLRGVTGSGKTYSIANVVASVDRPTLVISPNKTLAAQLFSEFRAFFPTNAVEYFVSYYDFHRGTFRVRGDVVEVFPANEESIALRIELFGDVVDALSRIDPLRGAVLERIDRVHVYPASHYVTEAS